MAAGTRPRGRWWYAGALLSPLAVGAVLVSLRAFVNTTEVALVFLLLILAIATLAGFGPAVVASLIATLAFNYGFLPPYYTLTIEDPANWFALFTFLATAAVTSRLVTTARQRSAEAAERAAEATRLHEFGRSLLAVSRPPTARQEILAAARGLLGADECGFVAWDGPVVRCDPESAELAERLPASPPAEEARLPLDGGGLLVLLPLSVEGRSELLAARFGAGATPPAGTTLQALASLVALAVEHVRLIQESLEAEVLRKSEAAKSALLHSVSHDVRTPLSAARIAATALQDPTVWDDVAMRGELLGTLDEATARLNRAVGNILYMSRIEAGNLRLDLCPHDVSEVVAAAIELVGPRRLGERLQVEIAPSTPPASCDLALVAPALANLLDNAVKYAPGDAPIEVYAAAVDDAVRIAVLDRGCGIAPGEESLVLGAFRRGSRRPGKGAGVGGMGLGLSIVKGLVEAHGGTVALAARPGGGTEAVITLPAAEAVPRGVGHGG